MDVISEHVYHPRLAEHYGEIYESLPDEVVITLNKLLWKLYRREIRVYEFERQAAALDLPKFQEEIWPKILRYDFLLIADYLGIRLQDWLSTLTKKDLDSLEVITLENWIKDVSIERDNFLSEAKQKKLLDILGHYLKGEKENLAIISLINSDEKFGGINLNKAVAKWLLDALKEDIIQNTADDIILTAQKIDEAVMEKVKYYRRAKDAVAVKSALGGRIVTQPKASPMPVVEPPKAVVPVVLKPKAEEKEKIQSPPPAIVKILQNLSAPMSGVTKSSLSGQGGASLDAPVAPVKTTAPFQPAIVTYEAEAEKIIRQINLKLDPELEKRLKGIVISRLKDIRKQSELREKLLGKTAENGIGLKTEEAEKVIKLAEEGRAKIMQAAPVTPAVILSRAEGSPSQKKETPKVEPKKELLPPVKPYPVLPKPAPVVSLKPATIPAKQDLGGVQAPRPATMQMEDNFAPRTSSDIKKSIQQAIKIVPQPENRPKVELTSTPQPVRPPQTVAIPQTLGGKARVEDVAYRPRLMGPLEELKEMSLLDFRRLSPKVKVATDKIYAKIELLGQESYQNKIRGIQAWQGSPVNNLYKAILNESLRKGLTVNQVIEEKQKRNEETLKPEEFRAVVELNRSLKV